MAASHLAPPIQQRGNGRTQLLGRERLPDDGHVRGQLRLYLRGRAADVGDVRNCLVWSVVPELADQLDPRHAVHLGVADAMWLGGSRGRDFPTLMRDLAGALRARPSLTLDTLLGTPSSSDTLAYPAAAALLQMAYERGKMSRVVAMLSGSRSGEKAYTVLDIAERIFKESRARLGAAWRTRVLEYLPPASDPSKGG